MYCKPRFWSRILIIKNPLSAPNPYEFFIVAVYADAKISSYYANAVSISIYYTECPDVGSV